MNISHLSYHTVDEILADALLKAGDKNMKYMSKGYYISQIQRALQKLSFDGMFAEKEKSFDLSPSCPKITMPKGAFNLKQVFIYNGECKPSNGRNVYWKNDYTGSVLTRDRWDNNNDPFYPTREGSAPVDLFYFGVRNGELYFSDSCLKFSKVLLKFNGLLCDVGDTPCIPMFYREAVIDFVAKNSLIARIGDEDSPNEMVQRWQYLLNVVSESMDRPYDGSWASALYYSTNLDNKIRNDIKEYMARLDY